MDFLDFTFSGVNEPSQVFTGRHFELYHDFGVYLCASCLPNPKYLDVVDKTGVECALMVKQRGVIQVEWVTFNRGDVFRTVAIFTDLGLTDAAQLVTTVGSTTTNDMQADRVKLEISAHM